MKLIIIITSIIVFGFFPLFVNAVEAGNKYYVTQYGNGNRSGESIGNSLSASDFNNLSGDYSGDTFFFSGTFTTRLTPKVEGSTEGHVIIDGYQAGDCDPLNLVCSASANLNRGMFVGNGAVGVDYLTIQDFRMTQQSDSDPCFYIYGNLGGNDDQKHVDHTIIRRNYVYETNGTMFTYRGGRHVVIEGNKFTHFGQNGTDAVQGVSFIEVDNALIKGNEFGHDEGSYPSGCRSANIIEIHGCQNHLWEHNDIYGAPNQAGIATKEWSAQENHIYRFNKFHDNNEVGLNIGGGWDYNNHMYVYGNLFYRNGTAGGSSYDGGTYHYWWSNIFIDNSYYGFVTWNRNQGSLNHIFLYNNTFARNGDQGADPFQISRGGVVLQAGSNFTLKNNLFYNNRPLSGGYSNNWYWQLYDNVDAILEHNTFYHSDGIATLYFDGGEKTLAAMQKDYKREDDAPYTGKVADPGFNNPVGQDNTYGTPDDDYALNGKNVNDGVAISQCFSVDIEAGNYTSVTVCLDEGLNPKRTNWTTKPPIVQTLKRETYGWSRGAYVFTGDATLDQDLAPPRSLRIVPE